MTNHSTSSPQRSAAGVSLRKTNKPLMEKRRRARINDSLSQLKSLVIQSSKKDSSQFNKLEKADILELTVKHLRNLQSRDQQQQMAQAASTDSAGKYCAGFIECANEVIRFLKQSQGFTDDVKARVVGHLASCLQFTTNQNYVKASPSQMSTPTGTSTAVLAPAPGPVVGAVQPPSATAAQLSNGQIIHIVNTPFQTAKPASSSAAPASTNGHHMIPVASSSPTSLPKPSPAQVGPAKSGHPQQQYHPLPLRTQQQSQQDQPMSLSVPATLPPSPNTSSNLPQDKSFTRFSQPLHIQIPATVSPFVIKADPHHNPQPVKRSMEENTTIVNVPPHPHQSSSKLPHQTTALSPTETVRSTTSSTPPSPLHNEIPIPTKAKQVHFYHPSDLHLANDYLPRHRSYSMTSSSSESELSPLNLSQSPVSTASSTSSSYEYSKELPPCPTRSQPRDSSYLPVSYKLEKISPPSGYSPYSYHHHHQHQQSRDLPENMDLAQANFTSVIVNARRSLDMSHSKYIQMEMEEDRLCLRQHSTPSPASSMGEERLWRPW